MPTNNDFDMGYITRALEDMKASMTENHQEYLQRFTTIEQEVAEIKKDWSVAKTVVRTVRWIGLLVVAIVTLKFGDIPGLWSNS